MAEITEQNWVTPEIYDKLSGEELVELAMSRNEQEFLRKHPGFLGEVRARKGPPSTPPHVGPPLQLDPQALDSLVKEKGPLSPIQVKGLETLTGQKLTEFPSPLPPSAVTVQRETEKSPYQTVPPLFTVPQSPPASVRISVPQTPPSPRSHTHRSPTDLPPIPASPLQLTFGVAKTDYPRRLSVYDSPARSLKISTSQAALVLPSPPLPAVVFAPVPPLAAVPVVPSKQAVPTVLPPGALTPVKETKQKFLMDAPPGFSMEYDPFSPDRIPFVIARCHDQWAYLNKATLTEAQEALRKISESYGREISSSTYSVAAAGTASVKKSGVGSYLHSMVFGGIYDKLAWFVGKLEDGEETNFYLQTKALINMNGEKRWTMWAKYDNRATAMFLRDERMVKSMRFISYRAALDEADVVIYPEHYVPVGRWTKKRSGRGGRGPPVVVDQCFLFFKLHNAVAVKQQIDKYVTSFEDPDEYRDVPADSLRLGKFTNVALLIGANDSLPDETFMDVREEEDQLGVFRSAPDVLTLKGFLADAYVENERLREACGRFHSVPFCGMKIGMRQTEAGLSLRLPFKSFVNPTIEISRKVAVSTIAEIYNAFVRRLVVCNNDNPIVMSPSPVLAPPEDDDTFLTALTNVIDLYMMLCKYDVVDDLANDRVNAYLSTYLTDMVTASCFSDLVSGWHKSKINRQLKDKEDKRRAGLSSLSAYVFVRTYWNIARKDALARKGTPKQICALCLGAVREDKMALCLICKTTAYCCGRCREFDAENHLKACKAPEATRIPTKK